MVLVLLLSISHDLSDSPPIQERLSQIFIPSNPGLSPLTGGQGRWSPQRVSAATGPKSTAAGAGRAVPGANVNVSTEYCCQGLLSFGYCEHEY